MTKKPKLNVSLLKRIVKHLREEPKRYNQSKWGIQVSPSESSAPACGTQGCIAGWTVFLSVPQDLWPYLFASGVLASYSGKYLHDLPLSPSTPTAQKLLGLTDEEAYALFSPNNQDGYNYGAEGVKAAEKKVKLLIRDRAQFVQQYGYRR